MPSIYLMQVENVANTPAALERARYDPRCYDIERELTFADAKRLIETRPAGMSVRTNSFQAAQLYELWFGICLSKVGNNLVDEKHFHFDDDIVLVHGSKKCDPWWKITFHPLREDVPSTPMSALTREAPLSVRIM